MYSTKLLLLTVNVVLVFTVVIGLEYISLKNAGSYY